MILYLVRHGDAKSEAEDVSRPLSDKGNVEVTRVASYLARIPVKVNTIYHSNKLRAIQTAGILAQSLKPEAGVEETDGIHPLDEAHLWARRLKDMNGSLMLVGHLPHLGKLSSLLLCADEDKTTLAFASSAVACLHRDEDGVWRVEWVLTPAMVA